MEINVGEKGELRLTKVYNYVVFETEEGEELVVHMRDGAFEIAVRDFLAKDPLKSDRKFYNWYKVSSQEISPLLKARREGA